jgi:hypothetical protein
MTGRLQRVGARAFNGCGGLGAVVRDEMVAHFNGEADWGTSDSLGEDIADPEIAELSNFLDIPEEPGHRRAVGFLGAELGETLGLGEFGGSRSPRSPIAPSAT